MKKQKAIVLFSGGRDSGLVTHLLTHFGYDVKLITANAGIIKNSWKTAAAAAKILNLPHEVMKIPKQVVEDAAEIAIKDCFPSKAINYAHKCTLEIAAAKYGKKFQTIADGTRRDDRTPRLSYPEMQSIEARYGISYFAPLLGFGHKTINHVSKQLFDYREIYAGEAPTSEYEIEIRAIVKAKKAGLDKKIFPKKHFHSVIIGLKKQW